MKCLRKWGYSDSVFRYVSHLNTCETKSNRNVFHERRFGLMSELEERLERINEHFDNITIEELEEKLIKAGIGEIKSCEEEGYIIIHVKQKKTHL